MIIEFINYTINGALLGLLYSLVAMGFVVIYRASKVFNMAIGEMIMVGDPVARHASGAGHRRRAGHFGADRAGD